MKKIIHTLVLFYKERLDPIQKYGLFLIIIASIGFELFVKVELEGRGYTGLVPVFSIIVLIAGIMLMILGKSIIDKDNHNDTFGGSQS